MTTRVEAPVRSRRGLSASEARELGERILSMSKADEMRVNLTSGWRGNTRYAVNRITTAGEVEEVQATLTARIGNRQAAVSTGGMDDASLRRAVTRAEALARLTPENPELMPGLGPQKYATSHGYFEATERLGPEARAGVAGGAIAAARAAGDVTVAGFLSVSAGAGAVAGSAGVFAYHASTAVDYSVTARTGDGTGSGWAGTGHRDSSEVRPAELHAGAIELATKSRRPRPLAAGVYTVVLAPPAVSDLVGLLASSLDARRADEGRSAFSTDGGGTRLGEQIVDPRVTIVSDPTGFGSSPFQGDGLPLGPVTWIEHGALRRLSYSRFWAAKQGAEPTGSPGSIRMRGEDASLEELVRGVRRGVLVSRLR